MDINHDLGFNEVSEWTRFHLTNQRLSLFPFFFVSWKTDQQLRDIYFYFLLKKISIKPIEACTIRNKYQFPLYFSFCTFLTFVVQVLIKEQLEFFPNIKNLRNSWLRFFASTYAICSNIITNEFIISTSYINMCF